VKTFGGHELAFLEMGRVLSIRFKFGAEVIIRRHPHPDGEDGKVSYLDVYVKNEDGFTKRTTGLLGKWNRVMVC